MRIIHCNSGVCKSWLFFHLFVFCFFIFFFEKVYLLFYKLSIKIGNYFWFLFFILNQGNQLFLVLFWVKKFFLKDFFIPLILILVLLHLKPIHFVFNFLFLYFWIEILFLIVSLCSLHFVHCFQWLFCCLFILLNLLVCLFIDFASVLRCFQ